MEMLSNVKNCDIYPSDTGLQTFNKIKTNQLHY